MKKKEEEAPKKDPESSKEEVLLTEVRDLLKKIDLECIGGTTEISIVTDLIWGSYASLGGKALVHSVIHPTFFILPSNIIQN